MAYMSQEKKAELAPGIKKILNQYGLHGSLKVRNHSTLVLTIRRGRVNFEKEFIGRSFPLMNTEHLNICFTGKSLQVLTELKRAMNVGNFDNSDITTDYFHVGWYIDIKLGDAKPYCFDL